MDLTYEKLRELGFGNDFLGEIVDRSKLITVDGFDLGFKLSNVPLDIKTLDDFMELDAFLAKFASKFYRSVTECQSG